VQRLILWGDSQFHPWQEQERPERWETLLNIIETVYQEAVNRKADHIIFLGDLFEDKRRVRTDIFSAVFQELLKGWNRYRIPHYILMGNHDIWNGRSILTPFKHMDGFTVITEPLLEPPLLFVPYGAKVTDSLVDYTVLFSHTELVGGNLGHDVRSIQSMLPEDLLLKRGTRTVCFNGHYHHPQTIKLSDEHVPVHCVGTPAELNWSDADSKVPRGIGFVTIKGQKVTYERIPLNFPRFFNAPSDEATELDFVRNLEEQKRSTKTKTHNDHDTIGGSEMTHAIRGYVVEKRKSGRAGPLTELGIHLYNARTGTNVLKKGGV